MAAKKLPGGPDRTWKINFELKKIVADRKIKGKWKEKIDIYKRARERNEKRNETSHKLQFSLYTNCHAVYTNCSTKYT